MQINSEEQYNRFDWYVLDKIKGLILSNNGLYDNLSYHLILYPRSTKWDKPNSTEEQKLINKFVDCNIIEIVGEIDNFQVGENKQTQYHDMAGLIYHLNVNETIFNQYHDRYKKLVSQHDLAKYEGNTLYFQDDGHIKYTDRKGKVYETNLKPNTNNFNLLEFLVNNPRKLFSSETLEKKLKIVKGGIEDTSADRRVRDTIQGIKNKLGYKENDLFEANKGFSLQCTVYIKK